MTFSENQAIYLQIANIICEQILLKRWLPDERIPSVREAAVQMEVNPNTVNRAYDYLQNKQIIYIKRGMGYFVEIEGYEKAMQLKKEEFLEHDVPKFMKNMKLLNMTCNEIQEIFDNNLKSK